jgi:hypothetical protein
MKKIVFIAVFGLILYYTNVIKGVINAIENSEKGALKLL